MRRLVLALLEVAPDEQTAQILVTRAVELGLDAAAIHEAWRHGEQHRRQQTRRGEVA